MKERKDPTVDQVDFVIKMLKRITIGAPLDTMERLRFAGCLQLMAQQAERGEWPK